MSSIFCVGRNYAEHARELGNEVPTEMPVLFSKSLSSVLDASSRALNAKIKIPQHLGRIDHEIEWVIQIGEKVEGYFLIQSMAVGIDLTARDLQNELKTKGLPWDRAKNRNTFAVIGGWSTLVPEDVSSLQFELQVNGETCQAGSPSEMIFPTQKLIQIVDAEFGLKKGDWIYTGTPAGVGPLSVGDLLYARLYLKHLPNTALSELWASVIPA